MCRSKANGGRRCSASRTPKVNSTVSVDESINSSTWKKYGFHGSNEVRRGIGSVEQSRTFLAPFEEEGERWRDSLDNEESRALYQYCAGGFEYMNPALRGEEVYRATLDSIDYLKDDPTSKQEYYVYYKKLASALVEGMKKSQKIGDQPHRLYRYIEAPQGTSGSDFVQKAYQVGQTVSDKGFMSTSLDSDCMVIMGTDSHRSLQGSVVFEILTDEGAVIHEYEDHYSGVQSDEREVLMPAGHQFEVVGIQENVTFETSREIKSMERRNNTAKKLKTTVVQLVDKNLIK